MAAETSCAPLHSMGFLIVGMMLLQRCAGMPWPGDPQNGADRRSRQTRGPEPVEKL